jgi:integrase
MRSETRGTGKGGGLGDREGGSARLKSWRYVQAFTDRHGQARYYFRRAGSERIALPGLFGSTAFAEAWQRAFENAPAELGAKGTVAGSINAAVISYYKSATFCDGLAASTQAWRRRCLEKFRKDFGDISLRKFERRHAQRYLSLVAKAGSQRNMAQSLSHFFDYCVSVGSIAESPAQGLKRARMVTKAGGIRAWTEEDVAAFKNTHPLGSKARLALALYLNFGVRKSDVVRIGPRDIRGNMLADFQPQKTARTGGVKINVPLLAETVEAIARTPLTGAATYLVTEFGKPFTANGFGNKMRQWCDLAGLPDCSSHGLRKLLLIRLAELGLNTETIMAISGHKNRAEVDTYVAAFNRKKLAAHAMQTIEAEQTKIKRVSNLSLGFDNRAKN